jgi:hypothetical protein
VATLEAEPQWSAADVFSHIGEEAAPIVELRLLHGLVEIVKGSTLRDAGVEDFCRAWSRHPATTARRPTHDTTVQRSTTSKHDNMYNSMPIHARAVRGACRAGCVLVWLPISIFPLGCAFRSYAI